jgi:hypothetical protein
MTAIVVKLDAVRVAADEAYNRRQRCMRLLIEATKQMKREGIEGDIVLEAHEAWTRVVRAFETPIEP